MRWKSIGSSATGLPAYFSVSLDDVQRRVLVADGEHRLFEGAPLDLRQEAG
jgi:hypothetical protein